MFEALLNLSRKKSPHWLGAGFFYFFLYASARTVTCGNGDGGNNGDVLAEFTHCDLFCLCLFLYLKELKQSAC
ncbi:hypothetical protein [Pantoea osteomyelitidis]